MVSNKKYNEVLEQKELFKEWFRQEWNKSNILKREIALKNDEIKKCCNTNRELINMVDDYKQKYLDEQHKRLMLAEKVEMLESKLNDAERCGCDND